MTEMVPSGLMRGHRRRSDGDAYTGTKLETAETAKAYLYGRVCQVVEKSERVIIQPLIAT